MLLPITYDPLRSELTGATWEELKPFYSSIDPIRQIERASIWCWMAEHGRYLTGRTLDFGSGTQPYSDLVTGEYVPFEKIDNFGKAFELRLFDAVICNQVAQYLTDLPTELERMRSVLHEGGYLLLTFPTNWTVCEQSDLFRFTEKGMQLLLERTGFRFVSSDLRASVVVGNFQFQLGYGMVAQK